MFAIKSIRQPCRPNPELQSMMETFRMMVNHCIRMGLENDATTMKKLSSIAYHELSGYDMISYYKLCAISQAAGRLANMKKSIKGE